MEGLASIFYNPVQYDVLPYKNKYNEENEEVLTGYFIPSYEMVNRPGIIDHRGWVDPEKGKEYYNNERARKQGDPKGLLIYCAEYCFTPREALALEGDNIFNAVALADQLMNIKLLKAKSELGEGEFVTGNLEAMHPQGANTKKWDNISGFKWTPTSNGKISILEHPIKDPNTGLPYRNLYVAGIDGIDMGQNETSTATKDPSQFCVVIKKRAMGLQDPVYVAIYKDRPMRLEEAHATALKLLMYYNCQAVIETTRTSFITYLRGLGLANRYLMRRPRACLSDVERGRSTLFGAQATDIVIQHQLELIAAYIDNYSYQLWNINMIEELSTYSYENKRKFDIVAAMGMAELGDEEMMGLTVRMDEAGSNQFQHIGYYVDEYGNKKYGVLPTANPHKGKCIYDPYATLRNYDDQRIRTSDPRYR